MISAPLLVCTLALADIPASEPASEPGSLRLSLGAGGGASLVYENSQVAPLVGAGPTLGAHWQMSSFEAGLALQSMLAPGDLAPSLESLSVTFGGRIPIVDGTTIAGSLGPAITWAHFGFNGAFGTAIVARAEVQQRIVDDWGVGLELGTSGVFFFTTSFAMAPAWLALTLRFGV